MTQTFTLPSLYPTIVLIIVDFCRPATARSPAWLMRNVQIVLIRVILRSLAASRPGVFEIALALNCALGIEAPRQESALYRVSLLMRYCQPGS